ncbi:MAG: translation initiation factor IF-2 [Armatimonadota bacterium]|nr:translation initiation factor IF-2 [Armatimonadota bacterium]MDR5704213.1 translation initiation factor IF-2 [Armatimonadota bacterium]
MRVYELARELGLGSKELMEIMASLGIPIKSHSSSIDDLTVERVRAHLLKAKKGPAAKPTEEAPPLETPPARPKVRIIRRAEEKPVEAEEAPVQAPEATSLEAATKEAPATVEAPPGPVAAPEKIEAPPKPVEPPGVQEAPPLEAPRVKEPPKPPVEPPRVREAPPKPPERPKVKEVPPSPPAERPVPAPQTPAPKEAPPAPPKTVSLEGPIQVGELAQRLGLSPGEVVKRLIEQGLLVGVNQQVSLEVARKVAESFGFEVRTPQEPAGRKVAPTEVRRLQVGKEGGLPRPPVVTVMGHVDHGKTTLLDTIRRTNIAEREFGGITQHIGASVVEWQGRSIVFIDTPGHEAFTALRARGAQVTDIAVLVVAADDGVMPQTVEAVNHAKAAGVPIIVAINKIDLLQANIERTKQQLSEIGLIPEEWGGDTIVVPVSAKTGQGVPDLLEMILLVADLQELRANPHLPAKGTIIESRLDRGRGPVATVLVQEGTLRVGDAVVAGEVYGKVRAMINDRGQRVEEAGPSMPVEVVGLSDVPVAGDLLEVVANERIARAVAEERRERRKTTEAMGGRPITLEELLTQATEGPRELRLILKADTHGSVEALQQAIQRLSTPQVHLNILHAAVGNITESDIMLAAAGRALVIGFNVRPEAHVRMLGEQENVEIRLYRIIYEVLEDLQKLIRGLVTPKKVEVILGRAEVRATFSISKVGTVAGCYVTHGTMARGANVRLIRDGVVVYDGQIASLRRFKEDVKEVPEGYECGIGLERFQDIKVGDILEAYEIREVRE